MNKKLSIVAAIISLIALAGGLYLVLKPVKEAPAPAAANNAAVPSGSHATYDARNATFMIDGQPVTLQNGVSSVPAAPGSASSVITRYSGHESVGDLTNDGQVDVAFVVSQEKGGSGVFYYAVAAIREGDGYKTTNAFHIGDRIAVQGTVIPPNSNELHVNFAERRTGEPMTAAPSAGAVLLLKVTPQGVLEGLMK